MGLRRSLSLLAVTGIALAVACDRSPAAPSPPPNTPPAQATVVRLELAGPPTVPPGGTAKFTLLALMSDGLMRDVTATAVWQGSSSNLLTISAGLATGRNRGDATITARHAGLSAVKSVMIVPTGTFRLTGSVQETVPPLGPVQGVRIEVAEGTERGLSTHTAPDGSFRLYGVTGDVELRLSKTGYATRTERLTVTDHQSQDFGLAIVTPRTDLSGRYALTIRAAPACDQAPEDMRERRYTADITQAGPMARVTLSGATFAPGGYYGGALNDVLRHGRAGPGALRPDGLLLRSASDGTTLPDALFHRVGHDDGVARGRCSDRDAQRDARHS